MPPTPKNPAVKVLDGTWFDHHKNYEAPLTRARWVTREGIEAFHLKGPSAEGPWSLQLARKNDEYHGDWLYEGERQRYQVVLRLYRSVHGEDEWILFGTWTESGMSPMALTIRLSPAEEDEE
jgi:hypothetical protein